MVERPSKANKEAGRMHVFLAGREKRNLGSRSHTSSMTGRTPTVIRLRVTGKRTSLRAEGKEGGMGVHRSRGAKGVQQHT